MLRSLNKPINLGGAKFEFTPGLVKISGKHGQININCPRFLKVELVDGLLQITTTKPLTVKQDRANAGTFRANLLLGINGVNQMHTKVAIFAGTGSGVKETTKKIGDADQSILEMKIGKSHIVEKVIPDGLICKVLASDIRETKLSISGVDAARVGQFASELCVKNPYKGGIHVWIEGKEIPLRKGKSN